MASGADSSSQSPTAAAAQTSNTVVPSAGASGSPSALPEAAASADSAAESARVRDLLAYYRSLSDNVVREGTAGWEHDGFGGVLMTEYQRTPGFARPISLVWLYDEQAAAARNDDQSLASHLKQLPALPHWTWSSVPDGDDVSRALILGDVAGPQLEVDKYKPIWNIATSLDRDAVWGAVLPVHVKKEAEVLAFYRNS